MMKAFAYLRVSGKGQVDKDGFTRQLEAIKEHAAATGYEIVEVFEEKGVSGKTELEDRAALGELFAALSDNGTKTVFIEKLDRLARDLIVQENIIADFLKSGYTLVSVCEPDLCSDDPSRVFVRQIFGAMAQYEKSMIVLKLRGARQRIRAKYGRCEGPKPFGELPGESETVQMMQELRKEGCGLHRIALLLNDQKIPTRYGKRWAGKTVSRILRREEAA